MAENQHGRDTFTDEPVAVYTALLWGMPQDYASVHDEHVEPFLEKILSMLRAGRTCTIYGMNSKDGTRDVNGRVAESRRTYVKNWLLHRDSRNKLRISRHPAPMVQPADSTEPAENWRGVMIRMTPPGI